jgi:6-phosphogluconolactonase
MADELLLHHLDIPRNQLLRPHSDAPAEEAASAYISALQALPRNSSGQPRFDVAWLGVGEDGHTLSLFPGRLPEMQSEALVIPVHNSPKPPPNRISLTLKAIRGTVSGFIMASGSGKASVVADATTGESDLPVARAAAAIEHSGGRVHWLLDKAAASR